MRQASPSRRLGGLALAGWLAAAVASGAASAGGPAMPVDVVKALYAAFGAGDMDKVLALVATDAVWTMHGPAHVIPYAGTYKGHAGVRQFFADIDAAVVLTAVVPRRFTAQGDSVTVLGVDEGYVKATGGRFAANHVHVWTVRDGRVVAFEEVVDTGDLVEAFAPADPDRGRAYFTTCAGCHGNAGQGNAAMRAPALTVQGGDYLLRQLRHFRAGVRGGPTDMYGWMMNGRARALPGDRAVRDVLAYIGTLPRAPMAATMEGDATAGGAQYALRCASCHGPAAEGIAALEAPALAGLQDWYLNAQMHAFRSGLRGAHPDDAAGARMRPAATGFGDWQAWQDVVAWIAARGSAAGP